MEIWRDVTGYEGLFSVSSLGRVMNVKRGSVRKLQADKDGYSVVILTKEGKQSRKRVHRLVCEAFNGAQPEGKDQVNHIDEIKNNNSSDNLHWCSSSENQIHSRGITRLFRNSEGDVHVCKSTRTFSEEHGLDRANLSRVINGSWASYNGWVML